jgi:hypothetical protein
VRIPLPVNPLRPLAQVGPPGGLLPPSDARATAASPVRHRAMRRRVPPSRTQVKSSRSVGLSPSCSSLRRRCPISNSPLTPSKPMGIRTPPLPAASPPPHCLPSPIKCAPAPGQLHQAHPDSPLFTSSPRAPRIPSVAAELLSPPSLARLVAPSLEVSPPLGSLRRPLASHASAASHRAPERPLG